MSRIPNDLAEESIDEEMEDSYNEDLKPKPWTIKTKVIKDNVRIINLLFYFVK